MKKQNASNDFFESLKEFNRPTIPIALIFVAGILVAALWKIFIIDQLNWPDLNSKLYDIQIGLMMLIWSFAGVAIARSKDIPILFPYHLRGKPVIVIGYLVFLLFISVSIYNFYQALASK